LSHHLLKSKVQGPKSKVKNCLPDLGLWTLDLGLIFAALVLLALALWLRASLPLSRAYSMLS
jgi:hypothetical protein